MDHLYLIEINALSNVSGIALMSTDGTGFTTPIANADGKKTSSIGGSMDLDWMSREMADSI